MLDVILQLAIFAVGSGYFVGLITVFAMQKKTITEKLGYATVITLVATIIGFLLIAALFGQGEFG